MGDPYTVEDMFRDADQAHAAMRQRGVVRIYFQHETLTPHNIRATREDVPVRDVPAIGQIVELRGAGYDGADARWVVTGEQWHAGGPSLTLTCADLGAAVVRVETTEYRVSAFPDPTHELARHYTVTVQQRGGDRWAVLHNGLCLSADGVWDYDDAETRAGAGWVDSHRFDLETALSLAKGQAKVVRFRNIKAATAWDRYRPVTCETCGVTTGAKQWCECPPMRRLSQ